MADTTYRVAIKYVLDTAEAERGTSRLAASFDSLKNLAVGFGVSLGLSALAKSAFELNSHLEKTQITLASMFQAGGFAGLTTSAADFATSMGMAREEVQQMRRDARDLPGTFDDLMTVFKGSLQGGGGAGKSIAQIEKFAAGMMATGTTLGFDSGTIGRDIAMMFQGRVGAHNAMWMQLRRYITDSKGNQMSDGSFKGLSDEKKWDALGNAVQKFQPGIDAFGKSWEAVSSTSEDYLQNLYRIGTAPVFEFVKSKLLEWNDYYEKNKASIDAMVEKLGGELAEAVKKGFSAMETVFGFIVEHKDALIAVAEAYAAVKVFSAARGIAGAIGSAGSFASTAMMYGSAWGGGGAAGLANSMGASALAFATSPATIAVVASAVLAYGGYKLYQHHEESTAAEAAQTKAEEPFFQAYNAMRAGNANKLQAALFNGEMVNPQGELNESRAAKWINDMGFYGTEAASALNELRQSAASVPVQANALHDALAQLSERFKQPLAELGDAVKDRLFNSLGWKFGFDDPVQTLLNKQGKPTHAPRTNVNVTIKQTIENANDPNRVLVKTREAVESIFRHPIETPNNRWGVVR